MVEFGQKSECMVQYIALLFEAHRNRILAPDEQLAFLVT